MNKKTRKSCFLDNRKLNDIFHICVNFVSVYLVRLAVGIFIPVLLRA